MAGYVVTGALVIAKNEDGSDLYLYEGAELPEHTDADRLKHLVNIGLVAKSGTKSK